MDRPVWNPSCNGDKCYGRTMDHVGWQVEDEHKFKVFCCPHCGKQRYVPWDHER